MVKDVCFLVLFVLSFLFLNLASASVPFLEMKLTMIPGSSEAAMANVMAIGWALVVCRRLSPWMAASLKMVSGQISIIPKPELRGFWGSSLIRPPFRVTSADVVIICPCLGSCQNTKKSPVDNEGYPLVNDQIAIAGISTIFFIGNTSTPSGAPIFQPAMLVDPGV